MYSHWIGWRFFKLIDFYRRPTFCACFIRVVDFSIGSTDCSIRVSQCFSTKIKDLAVTVALYLLELLQNTDACVIYHAGHYAWSYASTVNVWKVPTLKLSQPGFPIISTEAAASLASMVATPLEMWCQQCFLFVHCLNTDLSLYCANFWIQASDLHRLLIF